MTQNERIEQVKAVFPDMDSAPHRGGRLSLQTCLHQVLNAEPSDWQRRKADHIFVNNVHLGFMKAVAMVTPEALKEPE